MIKTIRNFGDAIRKGIITMDMANAAEQEELA